MNPNLKYFFVSFLGVAGGGGGGGGARVSDFFSHRIKFFKGVGVGVGRGVGEGIDGWTDEQAQTNLPLQLLRRRGHNNA